MYFLVALVSAAFAGFRLGGFAGFVLFTAILSTFYVRHWPMSVQWRLGVLGSFVVVIALSWTGERYFETWVAKDAAERQAEAAKLQQLAEQEFRQKSPLDHLRTAEQLLTAEASKDNIALAFRHLDAIPSAVPEATRAKDLKSGFLAARAKRDEQVAAGKLQEARRAVTQNNLAAASKLLSEATQLAPAQSQTKSQVSRLQQEVNTKLAARAREAAFEQNPIEVVRSNWHKGGFGVVAIWTVTFRNRSSRPVGNVKYVTTYSSETGDIVDQCGEKSLGDKVIRKVIPPKSTRTIEVNDCFVHSSAHRASFEVVGWEFVADQR